MILAKQDNYKACKACVSHQDYIVITHYDHQLVKDFGILWTDFESFQCFGMCGTAVQQQSKALFSNLTSGSLVWGWILLKSLLHARPKPRKAKCCEPWSTHFRRTPLFENSNQLKPGLRFCFEKNLQKFALFHTFILSPSSLICLSCPGSLWSSRWALQGSQGLGNGLHAQA